jgi:hypothetical protein
METPEFTHIYEPYCAPVKLREAPSPDQTAAAVADLILREVYPADYDHVFVYDNATAHKRRADGTLSARSSLRLWEITGLSSVTPVGDGQNGYFSRGTWMTRTEVDG